MEKCQQRVMCVLKVNIKCTVCCFFVRRYGMCSCARAYSYGYRIRKFAGMVFWLLACKEQRNRCVTIDFYPTLNIAVCSFCYVLVCG